MKSAFWRILAIAAIALMPNMANANDATIGSEAATSAMVGSTLNNTTALFNAWPHLVVFNGSGAEISTNNFGTNVNAGQARVWWEAYDELWLNLNIGRNDLGMQSAGFLWSGSINPFLPSFGNQTGYDAVSNPWINLGISKPGANGSAWSANVFFANDSFNDKQTGNDPDGPEFTDSATGYGALVSWGNGDGLHASAEFSMTTETDEPAADGGDTLEGDAMMFALNGRYDTDLYIYQGSFAFASGTTQAAGGGEIVDTDQSFLGLLVNAGRFLKNEVDGQTSAEFIFAYATNEAPENDKDTVLIIPGVRVSAWEMLTDYFGVMGGVTGAYYTNSNENTIETQENETSRAGFDYLWELGMFAQFKENVRIDFKFAPGALNNVLSLGNQEELVAYLGATVGLN